MKFIRQMYHVPAYRGARVRIKSWDGWTYGTVKSATNHVVVAPDEHPNARLRFHPTDEESIQWLD